MITENNKYTKMQRDEYNRDAHIMKIDNHSIHNNNPDYWNILLKPILDDLNKWEDKVSLDFGCGTGRNIHNLLQAAKWEQVDGVDISANNISWAETILCEQGHDRSKYELYINDGVTLPMKDEKYDFVMSTIVFQHICVYEIRKNLLKEIYRVLKYGGLFSFQMGFGIGHPSTQHYYENYYDAIGTNSQMDVRVEDPEQIINDLSDMGFKRSKYIISNSWSDSHLEWIFVEAFK
jgi:ubiquinone/menaquinone biosynthesis C-methylase UbiE